jgi:Flp pilus assembly protein TadG
MRALILAWWKDERGAAAAELGLLLVPMVMLLFGIVHLCLMTYAGLRLNYAAEDTARCMVVTANATTAGTTAPPCSSTSADLSYLQAVYAGPTAPPFFTATPDPTVKCTAAGQAQVQVQANYVINTVLVNKTIALTAQACYPHS